MSNWVLWMRKRKAWEASWYTLPSSVTHLISSSWILRSPSSDSVFFHLSLSLPASFPPCSPDILSFLKRCGTSFMHPQYLSCYSLELYYLCTCLICKLLKDRNQVLGISAWLKWQFLTHLWLKEKIEGAKGSYILSYSRVVYTVQSIKTHRDY